MKKYDVVIIGSGISSLTCAALLSQKGKSVCVLEQYLKPGGYMHCFKRFGQRFDTGAHYIGAMGKGQPFRQLLEYMNVYDEDLFTPLDPDGFDVFKMPDMEFSIPVGYEKLISRLSEVFPEEAKAIREYFDLLKDVAQNFPTYRFGHDVDMKKVVAALDTPLSQVVESLTQNPQLKFIFYSYCTLHGVDPKDVSLGMHAIVTDSLIQGAYGLKHGGDGLTNKFVQRIKASGGEVLTKKPVVKIITKNGLATAVETQNQERFECDWVISGIHPKNTVSMVDDQSIFSGAFKQRMERIQETVGLFGVYGKRKPGGSINPLKNYYYFSTNKPEEILASKTPDEEPFSIFMSPASREADENGAVHVNIHAVGPMGWFSEWKESRYNKRPEAYDDLKNRYSENIFSLIDKYEDKFRDSIDKFASSSPVTNLHFNGTPEGSPYGLYHSIKNTGARAIGPRTKIPNLLLTGQNCLFPGLLAAAITGLRTSGHIIGIKPVLREIRYAEMSL